MDIASAGQRVPFKLSDTSAAINDPDLAELKDKIGRGEITAEAPCDGMHNEWSTAQKDALDEVLKTVFKMN